MTPKKVILDTDPGVDDAMALLFLHTSPAIELVGITTTFGNGSIETTTRNALYLKQRFGIAAPVAKGAGAPLIGKTREAPHVIHGVNGLGDIQLPAALDAEADRRPAHQFISDTIRRYPGEVSIVAVARMTNLALALRQDPEIASLVDQVVIMGGAFGYHGHSGNVTPVAEANVHGDPLAADEVFAASWRLTCIGLDVTQETPMSTSYLESLRGAGGATGEFIWDITRCYAAFYREVLGVEGIFSHDPSAVACLIDPTIFRMRSGPIRVVTEGIAFGQTIQQPATRKWSAPSAWDGRPSHAVGIDVDAERLRDLFYRTMTRGESR